MANRVDGYDDEFDYTGREFVSPAPRLLGFSRRQPRDASQRVGERAAGDAAGAVLAGLQARAGVSSSAAKAMKVWRQLSDVRVRTHVLGLFLREGRGVRELIAYVDSPVWVHEFVLRAPHVLPEWNHLCSVHGIDMQANKLTFRLSSRAHASAGALSWADTAADRGMTDPVKKPLQPLTEAEQAYVARAVSVIKDDKLRERAFKTMTDVLRREKSQ